MTTGQIFCVGLIGIGVFLLMILLLSLAKRRMTESFSVAWGIVSVLLIVAGFVLQPTQLDRYVSKAGMLLFMILGSICAAGLYIISVSVSVLTRKNRELTMQISLMLQENEQMKERIAALEEKGEQ